jgi:hypothetical protein
VRNRLWSSMQQTMEAQKKNSGALESNVRRVRSRFGYRGGLVGWGVCGEENFGGWKLVLTTVRHYLGGVIVHRRSSWPSLPPPGTIVKPDGRSEV